MTKTSLSPEDVEQIIQFKGKLSAAEVMRRYNIGWERLQKLWNGATQESITRVVPTTKQDLANQRELQKETEQMLQMHTPQRELVVEDFFARLGKMEAKLEVLAAQMEGQTTQMEIQTETMQNMLDSLDPQCEEALQEIEKSVQEDTWFERTLAYCAATGFAVWMIALCKNKKVPGNTPTPVPTPVPTPAPKVTTPSPKVGWIKKSKTPDPPCNIVAPYVAACATM